MPVETPLVDHVKLINNVKTQVKKLMEESVIRGFVHEDSETITSLCISVQAVLLYGIRRAVFAWLEEETSLMLLQKISKSCPAAQFIWDRLNYHEKKYLKQREHLQIHNMDTRLESYDGSSNKSLLNSSYIQAYKSFTNSARNDSSYNTRFISNWSTVRPHSFWSARKFDLNKPPFLQPQYAHCDNKNKEVMPSFFWIRVALIEKKLDSIIHFLMSEASRYYESYSIIANPCDALLIVDLLRGPCMLNYSRMRTTDHLFTDPPVSELIKRHSIFGGLRSKHLFYVPPARSINCARSSSLSDRSPDLVPIKRENSSGYRFVNTDNHSVLCHQSSFGSTTENQIDHEDLDTRNTVSEIHLYNSFSQVPISGSLRRQPTYIKGQDDPLNKSVAMVAKDHVESMHQSLSRRLLFGKNNVTIQLPFSSRRVPGYLSLLGCEYDANIIIKWMPNSAVLSHGLRDSTGEMSNSNDDSYRHYGSASSSNPFIENNYWNYAIKIVIDKVSYIHCHNADVQTCLTLIGIDGIQLAQFYFVCQNHSKSFLHCLEQGLRRYNNFVDPPMDLEPSPSSSKFFTSVHQSKPSFVNRMSSGEKTPKLTNRNKIYHRLVLSKLFSSTDTKNSKDESLKCNSIKSSTLMKHSYLVFVKNSTSIPEQKHSNENIQTIFKHSLIKASTIDFWSPAESLLQFTCDSLRRKILSNTFKKWLSYCNKMRLIRSNLSSLVSSSTVSVNYPTNAQFGLTVDLWKQLSKNPRARQDLGFSEFCRLIYFGNCDSSIRNEVWPFLLGLYPWDASNSEIQLIYEQHKKLYLNALGDWNKAVRVIEQHEKYAGLVMTPQCSCDYLDDSTTESKNSTYERLKLKLIDDNSNESDEISSLNVTSEVAPTDNYFADSTNSDPPVALRRTRSQFTNERLSLIEQLSSPSADSPQRQTVYETGILDSLADNLYWIDKDVSRCDRNHVFFSNTDRNVRCHAFPSTPASMGEYPILNSNLFKLRNIICTWVWLHLDAGYVQGMCDLLAPLLIVIEDETLTYACFNCLMQWMLPNFPLIKNKTNTLPSPQSTVNTFALSERKAGRTLLQLVTEASELKAEQLKSSSSHYLFDEKNCKSDFGVQEVESPYTSIVHSSNTYMDLRIKLLKVMVQVFDPDLYSHLCAKLSECQLFFCYRWLLLDFKRELKYEDIFRTWEVIWSARRLVSFDFGLFLALAMLHYYRDIIIYYEMDVTEIMRFYNELAEQHDFNTLVELARSFLFQLQTFLLEN